MFSESQHDLEEKSAQLSVTSQNLTSTRMALTTTRQDLLHTSREKEERGFLIDEHVKTEQVLLGEAQQVSFVVVVVASMVVLFAVVAWCSPRHSD